MRDYLTLMSLAGTPYENILTDEAMLGLITRQKELNFAPGSEHLYSNSGYVLMAEIVKRATGRSLREYADEKIFRPLGMTGTHFHDDRTHIVRDRVFSYDPGPDGGWRTNYLMAFDKVGDGGLYSSVEDLARWDGAFYDDVLDVPGFAERMYERGVLTDGDTIRYARGLSVEVRRGLPRVSHAGGFMAFRTMIARYPEQRTTGHRAVQRRGCQPYGDEPGGRGHPAGGCVYGGGRGGGASACRAGEGLYQGRGTGRHARGPTRLIPLRRDRGDVGDRG